MAVRSVHSSKVITQCVCCTRLRARIVRILRRLREFSEQRRFDECEGEVFSEKQEKNIFLSWCLTGSIRWANRARLFEQLRVRELDMLGAVMRRAPYR
jgi:hypothetical protein